MDEKELLIIEQACNMFCITVGLSKIERKMIKHLYKKGGKSERELEYIAREMMKCSYNMNCLLDNPWEWWQSAINTPEFDEIFRRICCSERTNKTKNK